MAPTTLKDQCAAVGWPIKRLEALKNGRSGWSLGRIENTRPELIVAAHLETSGSRTSWCEGGSVNILIKAAALDVLTEHNLFQDRQDAVSRFLEAQLTLLQEHKSDVIASIHAISNKTLNRNIDELLANNFVQNSYPRVTMKFMKELAANASQALIAQIAEVFFNKPYEYRAGWPDLTVIEDGLRFVEVKTTDMLHESQIRFAREVATPLGLQCEVIQVFSAN